MLCSNLLFQKRRYDEYEIDYNSPQKQKELAIMDIFLHLDQMSDNLLTLEEKKEFVKILEKYKNELILA